MALTCNVKVSHWGRWPSATTATADHNGDCPGERDRCSHEEEPRDQPCLATPSALRGAACPSPDDSLEHPDGKQRQGDHRQGRDCSDPHAASVTRGGPRPDLALAGELPSFALKRAMRQVMDLGPPNWLFDALITTPLMRWLARRIYFHRRAQPGFDAPPSPGA